MGATSPKLRSTLYPDNYWEQHCSCANNNICGKMTVGWHQIQWGRFSPAKTMKAQRRQPRQGKIWFPTCLHPITLTDHAYLPAPIIQTQKKTCPTKRIFSKAEAKPTAAIRETANGAFPGEQGSSDSCQSGANTLIHDKLVQPSYLLQKDLQASTSNNPKDMVNVSPS